MTDIVKRLRDNANSWLPTSDHTLAAHNMLYEAADELDASRELLRAVRAERDELAAEVYRLRVALRDALRALTYKTDAITAELERLYRLIEQEQWSASQ